MLAGRGPGSALGTPCKWLDIPHASAHPCKMGYFLITGEGAHAAGIEEKIVSTAVEATRERDRLIRLCGRAGQVSVLGKNGIKISIDRLAALVQAELKECAP